MAAASYRQMHVIRKFEEAIRELYEGTNPRFIPPCVGQGCGCWLRVGASTGRLSQAARTAVMGMRWLKA